MSEEHEQQCLVVDWLKLRGLVHCSIPNAAKRTGRTTNSLKAEGMSKGAPDLVIFNPPPEQPGTPGTVIEMKSSTGKLSKEQEVWRDNLLAIGWYHLLGRDHRDVITELEELGY